MEPDEDQPTEQDAEDGASDGDERIPEAEKAKMAEHLEQFIKGQPE